MWHKVHVTKCVWQRVCECDAKYWVAAYKVDRRKPPSWEGFLYGWFPTAEPGGRGPPLKNNPNFPPKVGFFSRGGPLPPGSSFDPKRKLSRWGGFPTIEVCSDPLCCVTLTYTLIHFVCVSFACKYDICQHIVQRPSTCVCECCLGCACCVVLDLWVMCVHMIQIHCEWCVCIWYDSECVHMILTDPTQHMCVHTIQIHPPYMYLSLTCACEWCVYIWFRSTHRIYAFPICVSVSVVCTHPESDNNGSRVDSNPKKKEKNRFRSTKKIKIVWFRICMWVTHEVNMIHTSTLCSDPTFVSANPTHATYIICTFKL